MHYMVLAGREIFRFAVEKFIEQLNICLVKAGAKADSGLLGWPLCVN